MNKLLFTLLIILITSCAAPKKCCAQDTLQIPQSELDNFFLAIDTLREQDSLKTILISDLEYQLVNYKTLAVHDSTLLLYRTQEIQLLNEQIKLYNDRLKVVDKWYNKPWVGFIGGALSTVIMIHAIDYSLPQ